MLALVEGVEQVGGRGHTSMLVGIVGSLVHWVRDLLLLLRAARGEARDLGVVSHRWRRLLHR